MYRPGSQSPLHSDIRNIYQFEFARKNNLIALGVCFPQPAQQRWPQVCRVKITFTKLPTNRFVSTTKNSMKCVGNWIPLRIRIRSRNTQPHLKMDAHKGHFWNGCAQGSFGTLMRATRKAILTDACNGLWATDTRKVWDKSRMHATCILRATPPTIV